MRKRLPTEEEMQLWQQVTSHDAPLNIKNPKNPVKTPAIAPRISPVRRQRESVAAMPALSWNSSYADYAASMLGNYAGIDRNNAERFRKGDMVIEGTLDLHGMTQERAHHSLVLFVQQHWHRGSRFLLIITGKGAATPHNRNAGQASPARGILRESLPVWLAAPDIRPLVLACDVAKPKHGGAGAFYVLLRRRRTSNEP